jgi:hypothetical protein
MEEELAADKKAKLQLAMDGILSYCAAAAAAHAHSGCDDGDNSSTIAAAATTTLPPELQRIHQAVNVDKTDRLKGEILNGFSNYTYKIYLENDSYNNNNNNNDQSTVFAKVALTYALWNPDRSAVFSLDRSTNEKKMMEYFIHQFRQQQQQQQPFDDDKKQDECNFRQEDPPVCQPYFIMDLSPQARMLCNRFERQQQQWGDQFLNGTIDRRLFHKAARFIATINCTKLEDVSADFPINFNDGVKESFRTVCPVFKAAFARIAAQPATRYNRHFVEYVARQGGVETFNATIDQALLEYDQPEVLLHGDFHIMNIMVENMTTTTTTTTIQPTNERNNNHDKEEEQQVIFGPNASMHVCDFDMSHVGTLGRDFGPFFPFPIVCAFFFAAEGNKLKQANACIDAVFEIWKEYARIMGETSPLVATTVGSSSSAYLLKLLRSCIGWCGIYGLGANVILKAQFNQFPFDRVSKEMGEMVLASYCLMSLKSLEWGFLGKDRNPEFTVQELEKWFRDVIEEQVQFLHDASAASAGEAK